MVDKAIGIYIARSLFYALLVYALVAEADIVADIAGKEKDVLLYDADAFAQLFDVPLAHFESIDKNFSALNAIESTE